MGSHSQKILELARLHGVIRSRELTQRGLPRTILTRLVRKGLLIRLERGLYTLPDKPATEHISLVQVSRKCPRGIVCLLSALQFHELTTQSPFEVWFAIPNKSRPPKMEYPPLRIIRFSGLALTEGINEQQIDGTPVNITNVARTVADCFKHRNKIGLDVALEALREAWYEKRASMDDLWRYALVCRVTTIMRPYLESLA